MKRIDFKLIILVMLPFIILRCGNNESDNNKQIQGNFMSKDTLSADAIIAELQSDMWNRIELIYLDKNNKVIEGINDKKDTFFLKIHYNSLKFSSLNNNHEIFVNSLSDNCTIDKIGDKIRLIVNSNFDKDTVEYEVYLGSDKYLFESINHLTKKNQFSDKIRLSTFYEAFSLRK